MIHFCGQLHAAMQHLHLASNANVLVFLARHKLSISKEVDTNTTVLSNSCDTFCLYLLMNALKLQIKQQMCTQL